ncbi:2-oxo-4-hydroxy-4-carboxy-5-ureidoimidazoline decarboxylase [Hoeflea sp.]|uniref:2-oxo-4-hydroxy-4-carboxy-5-ureidoimidazoline decarboxylase n=1 Tax=Hoeflea sp. TaxID=1940281 RepID=UPI0019A707B4|nr:2-oxo-4-hydroxy-4-carboxy-5-ureidoimidazoline decarboxylase [Hoeflea sp.]MBC7282806.1 2-oxo-4-hydroxy-4-carboxy-5-ureidoimidazoline decarboxylase [Hoeflea sp.]
MTRSEFVELFGGVFEHSPFIAERAYDHGRIVPPLKAGPVHEALCAEFRSTTHDERLGVLLAHPDLAGKLAIAGELTAQSKSEQAGAGLDRLSEEEYARFTDLNTQYVRDFGFPFIIAVKGLSKEDILGNFEARIINDQATEFETACTEVEKIAGFRISSILADA